MTDVGEDLNQAASEGRLDLIREILSNKHINVVDSHGCALSAAVDNGHVEVVKYLLQQGANPGTAIINASSIGSVEMVKTLLEHGASIEDKDYDGKTPLHHASIRGQLKVVQLLISMGATVDARDMAKRTPLHLACGKGQESVVSTLVRGKAKVQARDWVGDTPLHHACMNGNTAVVKRLLKFGAKAQNSNNYGLTPLLYACQKGNTEVVKTLLALTSKHLQVDIDKGLILASQEGFHEIAEIMLSQGAALPNGGDESANPLFIACHSRHLRVVEILLAHGALVNQTLGDGRTPLHVACEAHDADIARTLIRHGSDVFHRNICGRSPMHYARNIDVLMVLMQNDADVNIVDNKGNTVLLYACNSEICAALLDYGAGSGLNCRKRPCLRAETGMMCHYNFCRSSVRCCCRPNDDSCLDISSHKNLYMIDCFEMHFIKLRAAQIPTVFQIMDPPNERVDWNSARREEFAKLSRTELEKMKNRIITNTKITYHNLLTQNPIDLQEEAILGNFDLEECLDQFPLYAIMLHKNYLLFRKLFLKKHSLSFFGLTKPWLPIECAERVVKHLSNQDLDVLVNVCHT